MTRSLRHSLFGFTIIAALLVAVSTVGAATATASLGAGSLSITAAPANFSYTGTLTGDVLNLTSSFVVGVTDATGSKGGWNLQAQIGTLTTVGGDTIPAANHTITGVALSGIKGTGPTSNVALGAIPTTSGKIYNATANTGMGQSTMTFATKLQVPADAAAGTYSATMTVTIVSGP
jgi:hypothetical protein